MAHLQCLLEHEAGLRHGAFGRVYQQQHAVDHIEHALDFAAEVGVAGGVDDVDLDLLLGLGIEDADGRVLCQDGDTALALQVVGVHDAFGDLLIDAKDARLTEKPIDQGCLAVVNVGDNGDVTQIGSFVKHVLLCFLSTRMPVTQTKTSASMAEV